MLTIGKINFSQFPLFLAPMEDVTDEAFRFACKKYGADMLYTEFVSSEALIRNVNKTIRKLVIHDFERPIGIQIYGNRTEAMIEAAQIAETWNPDLIDINFGCPVKKIALKGGGAGLLKDIPKMMEITQEVVKAVRLPVTVKTRLSWDEKSKNIVDIAEQLQDVGIAALCIHGRTREQMYRGEADWTLIGEVKNNQRMKIPIIGNGDINSAFAAKTAFDKFGIDAVMIGRASIGKPTIFKEIKQYLNEGIEPETLSLSEQTEILKEMIEKSVAIKNERVGILQMRRHLAQSFKGLHDFRELRIRMLRTENREELFQIFEEIVKQYKETEYREM